MAQSTSMGADPLAREDSLLARLLGLCEAELREYRILLELSRRQQEVINRGGDFGAFRRLLEDKRERLDAIARLEEAEAPARTQWEDGRHQWSARARARLHWALQEVSGLIEEILLCEEENDRLLLEKSSAC